MTLSTVLNHKFHGNYETLFTFQGGYLTNGSKGWVVQKRHLKESEKLEYFTSLAEKVVNEGIDGIENPESFVKRLNEEWTPCVFKDRKISLHDTVSSESSEKEIRFSSKITDFSFLSNFFPSLVVVKAPDDKENVFFTTEHAYMAWKVNELDPERAREIAKGTDPKKAKKEVKRLESRLDTKDPITASKDDKERVVKMMEIVRKKFEQNPVLKEKLVQTGDLELLEDTKDRFWGIGKIAEDMDENDPPIVSKKAPTNYLGKILKKVRGELRSPTS